MTTSGARISAAITVIEFGDFECPLLRAQAEPVVRELLADTTIRYIWRNLPLTDVHPARRWPPRPPKPPPPKSAFWPMHDLLPCNTKNALRRDDLLHYAGTAGSRRRLSRR